jgi:predicted membrane channel-forming protein YqfA (hemolysin III family)
VTAQEPDAAAPPNTFSYIAITCGVLAFVISWLIFGVLGVALSLVARGRREQRWKIGLYVTLAGMVLGLMSVALSTS